MSQDTVCDQGQHRLPSIPQVDTPQQAVTQSQQLSSALSSAGYFKSHCCKQCGPSSDYSLRSLIWVHTVCLYAKLGLKSLQEYLADDINRRHFQTQVFLAF